MKKILLTLLLLAVSCTLVSAQTYVWLYRTHATDCTSLTDGKSRDLCYEQSTQRLFRCVPSVGNCDTASEWKLIGTTYIGDATGLTLALSGNATAYQFISGSGIGYMTATSGINIDTNNDLTYEVTISDTGLITSLKGFILTPPTTQTIAEGDVITGDACGGLKRITASGVVSSNATNTFTNSTTNGCCMDVINVGSYDITLVSNANFHSAAATDVTLSQYDTLRACSDGSVWYQIGDTGNN